MTTLHSFLGSDGSYPYAGLIQATDGNFYGATSGGGANGEGTVFKMDSSGNLTVLHTFAFSDGAGPTGLVQANDGNFYGTTSNNHAFKIDSAGNLTTLHIFMDRSDGDTPLAALIQAADGDFYGTTSGVGPGGFGTVFKMNSAGNLTTLHGFGFSTGAYPKASLIQAADGNFYGTASGGGAFSAGTVFKIDSSGNLTVLHSFAGYPSDGANPYASMLQAADGNFYGTTGLGGGNNLGTVFKMDPAGNLVTLYTFTGGSDGGGPYATLIQATDGKFYGTTGSTVFKIDSAGNLTNLYRFTGGSDGAEPAAGLIQASDGNFYGTTRKGGSFLNCPNFFRTTFGCGTVFKMDPSGNLTTLYSFTGGSDGGEPVASLIQASHGNFYGTTSGGTDGGRFGTGTVFRMDSTGNLTTLHNFTGYDGANPLSGVILATDGNFYGTTSYTVFKMDSAGNLVTLHYDGAYFGAGVIQGKDGSFYGTTEMGGAIGASGVVFRLAVAPPSRTPVVAVPNQHAGIHSLPAR